jgi:hypothetical protein
LPLAAFLLRDAKWNLLHCDGASALLAAPGINVTWALPVDSIPNEHPIRVELQRRFHANSKLEDKARSNVAAFLGQAGFLRGASDILGR